MDINININYNNNIKNININFLLIGILIIASLLRFYNLGFQGAWLDEIHTLKEADPNLTFKEFDEMIMWREAIPHFYFLVVRFFSTLFGHELVIIRLVSAICGILTVLGLYKLGKELISERVGYFAAIIAAFHPFLIEYSQEGRPYAMLALFVTMAFYYLVKFLKNTNLKNAILLGLFSGLITNAQPIGIVNVLSIYLVILLIIILEKDKTKKVNLFKYSFFSGVISVIIFSPVYLIVSKLLNGQNVSTWIPKPTFESVVSVLLNVSGKSLLLLIITIISYILVLLIFLRHQRLKTIEKKNISAVLVLSMWVFFFIIFMLLKSKEGASLVLQRYFISLTPAFILIISIPISYVPNKIFRNVTLSTLVFVMLYVTFQENNYYKTRVKSQFNDVCQQIKNENKNNEVVISNWGWLLTYFLDRNNEIKNVYEKNLDLYINDVKTNSVTQENFWYIDGNYRPYSVTPETQEFLDKNYTIEKSIDLHDCWAKHYISKKISSESEKFLRLNQFRNAQFDGSGNLMFFENSKSSALPITLEKGKYSIEISCLSFPKAKIGNENAKFTVFINDKNYGSFEASEKEIETIKIEYNQETLSDFQLAIAFTNDFSKEKLDRNLQISKIEIKRK